MRPYIEVAGKRLDLRHAMTHGAAILLLLREGKVSDWRSLCEAFGVDTGPTTGRPFTSGDGGLRAMLRKLHHAGLVVCNEGQEFPKKLEKIRIADAWADIQEALDISLTSLASYDRDRSILVDPWFGAPEATTAALDVFVVMPFREELTPVYDDHIVAVTEALGLKARRGDDFFKTGTIVSDVWNAINAARVVIADCTGRNPNVFYEMGLVHAIGKTLVLITQSREDVPFDIQHLRYLQYEFTPRGMRQFETNLRQTLIQELGLKDGSRK